MTYEANIVTGGLSIQYELPQRITDLPLTLEHVKQRLVKQYRPHSRYFACPW